VRIVRHVGRLRRSARAVLAATVAGSLVLGPAPTRAAEPPSEAAARHLAALTGGNPDDYALVYERTLQSAGAEVTRALGGVWGGKLVDPASGQIHTVYVTPEGEVGGHELLAAREATQRAALTPMTLKAEPALVAATSSGAELLGVAVWVEAGDAVSAAEGAVRDRHPELTWQGDRPVAATAEAARAIRAELWEARCAAYDGARASVVAHVAELGGSVAYQSTSAPLLFADLPPAAVDDLAARADVLSLDLEGESRETMSSAGPTVSADWTTGGADQGGGARVAIVEYHNVHTSGDLAGQVVASHSTTGSLAYASGAANHPTWVAGAVASLNASFRGVAPGADIVTSSTGGYSFSLSTDRAIIAAADWAVAPGGGDADVVNTSIGQDTAQGAEEARRYFDSVGWEDNRVLVSSAGNHSTFGHWDVLSPGTGWNVITVGGVNDRGTGGIGDDVLWYGSDGASYRDPAGTPWNAHGDFNKPNVSAPAVDVRTANGMIGSGTSIASPIVAGIAAQLMARDPTLLTWPEAVRALIMAGASRHTPMPDGSVNGDHEGVGTASALWSNRALENGAYGGYAIGSMSAGQTPTRQIAVTAGQRVRVALSWSSHTSGSSNLGKADALTADLDLQVFGPDGTVVRSLSFDNNYEVVDILATRSGTLTMQVLHDRFDAASEPYALAWTIGGAFSDVTGHQFEADIAWAVAAGVTTGCGGGRFCPDSPVTREQMASFLVRALGLPQTGADYFTDDEASIHEFDINRLAAAGIATGCGGGRYCPTSAVSREQMASFLVRALGLPHTGADYFTDDEASIHELDINRLAASGITGGCGGGRYCPSAQITRGQMAAFLHRALGG
jgi:hypothetical protein